MLDLHKILPEVAAIARGAGEIALRHFAAPIPIKARKSTRSDVVTAADTELEAFIVRELVARFPDHHIVGEEGGGQGAPAESAKYHWFVDPIDGTVNFAAKVPHYSTSIALATPDRQPLLGIIQRRARRRRVPERRTDPRHDNGRTERCGSLNRFSLRQAHESRQQPARVGRDA